MATELTDDDWHWFVHPLRTSDSAGPADAQEGSASRPDISADPGATFERSFEQISAALEELPRMFLEPDGSFVWRTRGGQLDGQIHDSPDGCRFIELKGKIGRSAWSSWLACVDWPRQGVVVQLARAGTFLAERDFAAKLPDDEAR